MADSLLPSSVGADHISVFEQILLEEMQAIPFEKMFVYLLDTCDAQALPFLARQFNVLGNRGWRWADTEQKQRELLKRAIIMQRKEGTPFAVKESLKVVGIENAQILHPIPGYSYDGTKNFNGTITYGGAYHWACFKVLVDIYDLADASEGALADAVLLINEWKNVRSWLIAIEVAVFVEDTVTVTDDFEMTTGLDFNDQVGPATYDGTLNYDGSGTFASSYDEFEIEGLGPALELVSITPDSISHGTTVSAVASGFGFVSGTIITHTGSLAISITATFVDSNTLNLSITVATAAPTGSLDLSLLGAKTFVATNPDSSTSELLSAITVV